ncbi:folylpolyglutamate synthase [Variibacter gotjawalensis]|uniref:Dihydrofolate synthase/folylpolyglutamate synthase n=1 Tax=Variibacter gotjawalensis TaxID=1333996 RepID=A0A0S3Q0L9_9BRAD|nr:folylpolyglutamate synthase/dihydrofolate synthase family protein [Variibacter gotjawalensis]NIK47563.1 dihydrofolate synthase/folylpolyglutamate synthase [Variibacter gotjawalensis]RZS49460.1 dihydrofolate synthase/folylpolyglutamate synthase [Variibacter gotjawalensis]BAT61723.1 folylpolyglutamate synthase [Variibacter gotjawalensis]
MNSVDAIAARLAELHPRKIDLSLGRMHRLLAALGHPERDVPPAIQVAGTNGKGSTVAFLRAILEAAGKRVHTYTSPHLVRINERYRLGAPGGGKIVDDETLAAAFLECEKANAGEAITQFEITTAAGFLLFARHPADVLLLEVGLGGRLDATTVIDKPAATVITPISRDHVEFLGDTIPLIAAEKAGIIRPGVPCITATQPSEALTVIERTAAKARAPLLVAGEDWTVGEENGRLVYQDDDGLLDLPAPRLSGHHQFENAGTAIATLRALKDWRIPTEAYEKGVAAAEWPARMQRIASGKLTEIIPPGAELWLDGGHNAAGGRIIAAALADIEERVSRPLVLVVGMLSTKDIDGFLQHFSGLARRLIAVPIPDSEKAVLPEQIVEAARRVGIAAEAKFSLTEALDRAAQLKTTPPPRILITGSLYLAGDVLRQNETLPT